MLTLLATKQKKKESVQYFIKRFCNISLQCPHGMPQKSLVKTCRHNISVNILAMVGAVKSHTRKELVIQAENAGKIACRLEAEEGGSPRRNNSGTPQLSQSKRKETIVVNTPDPVKPPPSRTPLPRIPQKQYSFKDEYTVTIFNLLIKNNILKLSEVKHSEEVRKVDDINYCRYHRIISYPTKNCYILKVKIQVLVDANVINLQPNKK